MRKHKLVITQEGQWIHTPVSSPVNDDAWLIEEVSIKDLKKIIDIEIIKEKGKLSSISIPLDIPDKFHEITDMEELRTAALKKLNDGNYSGWIVNTTKSCFNDGTLQNLIFLIIRDKKKLTRNLLIHLLKKDYDYEDSGTVNGTLQALRDIIGVIEDEGRGDDRVLKYIGKV
jgi:hypothetical protein